jgi:hypothetical protein
MVILVFICLYFVPFEIEKTNYGPFGERNPVYYSYIHSDIFNLEGSLIYSRLIFYLIIPAIIIYLINKLLTKN